MNPDGQIRAEWLRCMKDLARLERQARYAELTGSKRPKWRDERGLEPISELWGRVEVCEVVCPYLRDVGSHPTHLRAQAREAAEQRFRQEILSAVERTGHPVGAAGLETACRPPVADNATVIASSPSGSLNSTERQAA